MKWLFVTSQFPWPLTNGQWLRVFHLARALRSQGDEVSVLTCAGEGKAGDSESDLASGGNAAYESLGVNLVLGFQGRHADTGRPRTLLGPYAFDERMARAVAQHSSWADAVILSHSRMLQYSGEAARSTTVIADIGDDPVLEYGRRRRAPAGPAARLRGKLALQGRLRYERRFLAAVDAVTFVSQTDAESYALRHPRAHIGCVANGVDVDYFQRAADRPASAGPPTLVFTGQMSNPNNVWAAEFLVRRIAPLVWERREDVRVQIVGAAPSAEVRGLAGPRVEVTGTVADIRPYLWNATIVTLPMQSGTGIKNKLLEAWAAAAPVVATPIACQGIAASDGRNLCIASTAEQFAAGVLELLGDAEQRQRLSAAGRDTVTHGFTWEAAAARLRAFAAPASLPAASSLASCL